jgi:hypothetical protein
MFFNSFRANMDVKNELKNMILMVLGPGVRKQVKCGSLITRLRNPDSKSQTLQGAF